MNGQHPQNDMSEALRQAVERGHIDRVVDLLKRGAPSVLDQEGQTPLHIAASAGHIQLVDALIQAGCDVTVQDFTGHTALQRAAAEGHLEIVKTLLENGISVDHQDEVHGNTALHEAAWKGFSQTVQILCKWKANAYIKNRGGFAPLHLCCQNGHNETCRVLLLAGCKPDIKNNYGDTPLHTGARYGHAGVIRILVSANCNPSEQNKNGDTALHIAAAMGRRKLTRVLLESGCNKDVKNKQTETALEIAHRKNLREIVSILHQYNHKSPRTLTTTNASSKFPEKSVDDTTEEEFDVDAIMKDPNFNDTFNSNHNNNNGFSKRDRSSSSSKENQHQRSNGLNGRSKRNSGSRVRTKLKKEVQQNYQGETEEEIWSPYGYHPQLTELDEMFKRNPRAIKEIMEQLNPGEQFYLDLAGNIRKGPSSRNRNCYCAPVFSKFEKRLEKDHRELMRCIDQSQLKIDSKIAYLEKKTKEQLFGLNQSMKEAFAAERGECLDRMDRRALRERIAIERQQVLRDVALKRELAIWLDAKLTEIEKRHDLDAKNAALLRTMAIKRLSKYKKGKKDNDVTLRRAHSEELLSEVGVDETSNPRSSRRSSHSKKLASMPSINGSTDLLQVSDHPRMRHNSADNADAETEVEENENNYENFAHELSNSYWSPVMTNTRDLTNHHHPAFDPTKRLVQVDLNSTNSDSNSHRSLEMTSNHHIGNLSVSSRPSSSVSPERRLDMVLGSEVQFSDQNHGFKQLARPIPTFTNLGNTTTDEVHLARPAYAPTPSPGGCSEDSGSVAPPLPARQSGQQQPGHVAATQFSNNSTTQPHSLPFFPFHQFPGRSVKPMLAPLDENEYSPGEEQADSLSSQSNKTGKFRSFENGSNEFPSLLNVPLGSDGQGSHDSHNDSGYSTRFGYSAGPSPSLSGKIHSNTGILVLGSGFRILKFRISREMESFDDILKS